MRFWLSLVFVVLLLLAGAVFIGPQLIPSDVYRTEIAKAVEGATGRALTIEGDVSLKVFPALKARVAGAKLANVDGGKAPYLAEVGSLDAGLALWPLLSRRVEITSFVLEDAVIHLEVDKAGKGNWEFEPKQPAPAAGEEAPAEPGRLSELTLEDVRLVNGLVTYADAKTGAKHEVSGINAALSLAGLDQPFEMKGDATYGGEALAFEALLGKARAAVEGGSTDLKVSLKGNPLAFDFDGKADFGAQVDLDGATKFETASVRRLAAWAGSPIEGAAGFGPMSLQGLIATKGTRFTFSDAALRFDEIRANGALTGDFSGAVPFIVGKLKTDRLDLRPYVSESAAASGGGASGGGGEWSAAPIDASPLRALNADIAFEAGEILVRDLKIGRSNLAIKLAGGVLTANLKELALYQGLANGVLTLDGRGDRLAVKTKLALSGLDLEGFLKDAMKSERFIGTGRFEIDLAGQGRSQKDIIETLAGNAAIKFTNGAIKGVDLVKVAAVVNRLTGKEAKPAEGEAAPTGETGASAPSDQPVTAGQSSEDQTRFVEFGGTFQVARGIMTNADFKMLNELISLTGQGTIDLPRQAINFRLDPGKSQDDGGLKVALRVTGPLSAPKFTPDASALIRNEIKDRLGDGPAADILGGILGGGEQKKEMTDGEGEPKKEPAKELLKDLFGR